MRRPLTIAAAQPRCTAKDVRANVLAHAEAIRTARARVVVFPELSLTGYELDAAAVSPEDEALAPLTAACAETGTIAFAGAPVGTADGSEHIATLKATPAGIEVAYRKSFLGEAELARFSAGAGATAVTVDGWRIGLGICKDTGIDRHVLDTAALGIDLYVAGVVHRPDELGEQERRGRRIARLCEAYVAFASYAGPTGGGYAETAGVSTIWSPDGTVLARTGGRPGELASATLAPGVPA